MPCKDWLQPDAPTLPAWAGAGSGPVAAGAMSTVTDAPRPAPDAVVLLPELPSQEEAVMVGIAGSGGGFKKGGCLWRLEALGLRPGQAIRLLHKSGCGLVLVQVNGTRLALGRGVAARVLVRRTIL